jgi:hypothetical protein
MGNQLVAAVRSAVTPDPPPGTPGWAHLSAVLAERRRREEERLRTPNPAPSARAFTSFPQPTSQPTSQPIPPTDPPSPGPFTPPA